MEDYLTAARRALSLDRDAALTILLERAGWSEDDLRVELAADEERGSQRFGAALVG